MATRKALWVMLALTGCAGGAAMVKAAEEAESCTDKLRVALFSSTSCAEAQRKNDETLRTDPACRTTYRDAGFEICGKLHRDGGAPKEGGSDGSD